MREALAEALSDFDGAIVMVSHDRHLIGLVCDKFVRVAEGKVAAFDGDLDEYAAWLRSRPGNARPAAVVAAPPPPPAPKPAAKINPHTLATAQAQVHALDAQLHGPETPPPHPATYARHTP